MTSVELTEAEAEALFHLAQQRTIGNPDMITTFQNQLRLPTPPNRVVLLFEITAVAEQLNRASSSGRRMNHRMMAMLRHMEQRDTAIAVEQGGVSREHLSQAFAQLLLLDSRGIHHALLLEKALKALDHHSEYHSKSPGEQLLMILHFLRPFR